MKKKVCGQDGCSLVAVLKSLPLRNSVKKKTSHLFDWLVKVSALRLVKDAGEHRYEVVASNKIVSLLRSGMPLSVIFDRLAIKADYFSD